MKYASNRPESRRRTGDAGFTLMELLVVIAVIVLVSGAMLVNMNKFGGAGLTQNLAYDIALSMREAQVYGIAVQNVQATGGNYTPAYGMYFKLTDPTHYNMFADFNNASNTNHPDGVFQASWSGAPTGESLPSSPYTIGRGFSISDLCVTTGSTETCGQSSLTIIFIHPEPDAWINPTGCHGDTDNSEVCNADSNTSARIVVSSPRGDSMNIIVSSNGQISVSSD